MVLVIPDVFFPLGSKAVLVQSLLDYVIATGNDGHRQVLKLWRVGRSAYIDQGWREDV